MSEATQSCIVVMVAAEDLVSHSHAISVTIAKNFESYINSIVGSKLRADNEDYITQTVTYKVNDTNMFAFIIIIQDFRNNGWNVLSSNSYLDTPSQQLIKTFYLEKMVSQNFVEGPPTLSPQKVCMSAINDNKQKELAPTSAAASLLETSTITNRSVPAQSTSTLTSPVRRLSQLGRDDKYVALNSEPENVDNTFNKSSSSSTAAGNVINSASVEKNAAMTVPAVKPKSLLEARRASLSGKTRSPSFTSEGLKILNDYSNKIAVELDRNEIIGTVVSNTPKPHIRSLPPVPVAVETVSPPSRDHPNNTTTAPESEVITTTATIIAPSIPQVQQKQSKQQQQQQQQQTSSPAQSPLPFKDLSPFNDNNSSFSPTPVASSSSSSSYSPTPSSLSSSSTPAPVSTPKAPFSMTKTPVFTKLTPKFLQNNEENEEIKKKNENFFKKMVEDEELQKSTKLEQESRMDPEELAKLRALEKEKEDHESMKAAHFKRLGAATVVSRGSLLMGAGRGRGFSSAKR